MKTLTRYREYWGLYEGGQYDEICRRAEEEWARIASEPAGAENSEICRIAMLAWVAVGEYARAAVWRARALRLAVLSDWVNGVAALVLSDVFRFVDAPREAIQILDEMQILAERSDPNTSTGLDRETLLGIYQEKRGFLLYSVGDYHAAVKAYEAGLRHSQDSLRRLELRGGRALSLYLGTENRDEAVEETREVLSESRASGFNDVAETAAKNLDSMSKDSLELIPYEIL